MDLEDLPLSAVEELRTLANGTDSRPFVTWAHYWMVLEDFGFVAIEREGQDRQSWKARVTDKGLNALSEQLPI